MQECIVIWFNHELPSLDTCKHSILYMQNVLSYDKQYTDILHTPK